MGTHYQGTPEEMLALDTYIKLQRAADTVLARTTRNLSDRRLTTSQFGVLEALYHLGPLSQREIAQRVLKTPANITTVIDNLEKRGLVVRERNSADRRFMAVQLTDAGRHLITEVFPKQVQCIVEDLSILSAAEQNELGRLLRRLGRREGA